MPESFSILGQTISVADVFTFVMQFVAPSLNGLFVSWVTQKLKMREDVFEFIAAWEIRILAGVFCAGLSIIEGYLSGTSTSLTTFVNLVFSYTVAVTKYDHSYKGL